MLLSIWNTINHWDQQFFIKLNNDWTNPFFDSLLPWMRESTIWIPLYLMLLVWVIMNFKTNSLWWILLFICTVAITDMTGTNVFKHVVERLRPCRDPHFFMHVRLLLKDCSGGYSFTSNHAANHFGMAMFFWMTFKKIFPRWAWVGFIWAGIIAYSQVYVGVHYPLDVIAGAILGLLFGFITGQLFNKRLGFHNFEAQPTVSP